MGKKTLVCQNIGKKYNGKEVLKDINLELEPGKIYGLIGRNGAGKTTLLSIMSSQNPPTSGTVSYGGEPVWENEKVIQHICFSREISTVSAMGNANTLKVKDYLRAAKIYLPNWDQAYAGKLIAEFGLDTNKKISKLSKGMLSMVTIIIALASKAEYTILDEPVAGLDVIMRELFYRLLLEEYGKTERTFVISTHIIEEAADVFEEVIILDEGQIIRKENTQELLEHAVHVSGKTEAVDAAVSGLQRYHEEKMGRSKGVTVLLRDGEAVDTRYEVSCQPVNLQHIFVALCGKEVER